MKWNKFPRNAKKKEELINIIVNFIKSNKGWQLTNSPVIVTAGDKIYIFQGGHDKVKECNHEKTDIFVLLASQEIKDVVVMAKDTDVLVYLFGHKLIRISNTIGSSKNIPKICDQRCL